MSNFFLFTFVRLCSNVVLLIYVGLSVWGYGISTAFGGERTVVMVVLAMGFLGLVLLAFLWNVTTNNQSVALLSLTIVAGVADSMSSVVFLPILSYYPRVYATPFAVGEASTSLVATLLAIVQDPGGADRFSVTLYFLIIAAVTVCSGAAYLFLYASQWRTPRVAMGARFVFVPRLFAWDLVFTVLLNFCENGVMVSLLTFCLLPYGDGYFKAALWGGMIAAPLGSVTTLWFARGTPLAWSWAWGPTCVLVVVNASVRPIIAAGTVGYPVFLVLCIIVARFFLGFTKALIYFRVLELTPKEAKEGSMLLIGLAQQAGASIGSLLFFLLIYYGFID